MEVKIKKLHESAVIPYKKYDSDFCYDVVAVSEEKVAHNVWKYGLGIALQIERGDETILENKDAVGMFHRFKTQVDMSKCPVKLSIDLRPRSSIYKTGMVLSCATGTIDENYTNEISAIFYHVMPNMPRYKVGDRIGQIKIGITLPITFKEVEELDDRDRGMNGYGSTETKH